MGQAKYNPLSPQFAGEYPDEILTTGVVVYERPSPDWMAANPGAKPDTGETLSGEMPGPKDVEVSVMLTVQRVKPSSLHPGEPNRWERSEPTPLGPLLFFQNGEAIPAIMTLENYRKLTPLPGKQPTDAGGNDQPDQVPPVERTQ